MKKVIVLIAIILALLFYVAVSLGNSVISQLPQRAGIKYDNENK